MTQIREAQAKHNRLERLLDGLNLSKTDLATHMGVSGAAVAQHLNNGTLPKAKNLEKLKSFVEKKGLNFSEVLNWLRTGDGDYAKIFLNPDKNHVNSITKKSIIADEGGLIRFVPQHMADSYIKNFDNPEFIMKLPTISIPEFPANCIFSVSDNDMWPMFSPGQSVAGILVEDKSQIDPLKVYIIIAKRGILIRKVIYSKKLDAIEWFTLDEELNMLEAEQRLIPYEEVHAIYKFSGVISKQMPPPIDRYFKGVMRTVEQQSQAIIKLIDAQQQFIQRLNQTA